MSRIDARIKVLLLGGGGHAKVVIDAMRCGAYEIEGILESSCDKVGTMVCGIPVVGTDQDLTHFFAQGVQDAVIAIGHMGDGSIRRRLAQQLRSIGYHLPTIIHPQAIVSPFARIGDGTVVFAGAVVNACAQIGEICIINTAAVVEHDAVVKDGVHMAPRALLSGGAVVGEDTMIGMGSCVLQGRSVGKHCIIGAGSVVIHDVNDGETVVGVPARCIKRSE